MIKLIRPLAVLDIESTGLDTAKDRIIHLAIVKVRPDGGTCSCDWKFNPGFEMSQEVIAIHGISNEDLALMPKFIDRWLAVENFLTQCDLAGFNLLNFDIPILWEEFYRCDHAWDLSGIQIIDAGNIFKKMEPRDLTAAIKFYCGHAHVNAHSAFADAQATLEVLFAQISKYTGVEGFPLQNCIQELSVFSRLDDRVDLAGKILRDKDGDPCYNFGQQRYDRGRRVGLKLKDDPTLAEWALGKDFPSQTKLVLRQCLEAIYAARKQPLEEQVLF